MGFQLQEEQLDTFQIQSLQPEPEQWGTGVSGQSEIIKQFWTFQLQTLHSSPEQGGNIGLLGSIWFPVLFQKL